MGTHTEIIDTALANCSIRRGRKEDCMIVSAIADNFQIGLDMPPVLFLQATAARDVLMPADATTPRGQRFTIVNTGVTAGATITLKTSADAALTPAVTVAINAAISMVFGGGTGVLGWRRTDSG